MYEQSFFYKFFIIVYTFFRNFTTLFLLLTTCILNGNYIISICLV